MPVNYYEVIALNENPWCFLQRIAKKHLLSFNVNANTEQQPEPIDIATNNNRNKYLKLMTLEQRKVFCGIYHYGKTISQLSAELHQTENFIRKTLKEAFAIIKKAS